MDIAGLAETLTGALGTFEPERYSAADCARLAARRFRSWRDSLGMVRIDGALPPASRSAGRAPPAGPAA